MTFCGECLSSFLSGSNLVAITISLSLSFAFLIILRWKKDLSIKKKLLLMYSHLFALFFPFLFFLFYKGCEQIASGCRGFLKLTILLVLTGAITLMVANLLGPILFVRGYVKCSKQSRKSLTAKFVKNMARKLSLSIPQVYFVDSQKPFAFSLDYRKSAIFISIGLTSLLSWKECQAVLLHELFHLKSRASVYKLSTRLLYVLSPASKLACFYHDLSNEERAADSFAAKLQKTHVHVTNAKGKVRAFYTSR